MPPVFTRYQKFVVAVLKGLAEGKTPQEKLFGDHWRDWVRKWVKRICLEPKSPRSPRTG
jgi:hypothetical protein